MNVSVSSADVDRIGTSECTPPKFGVSPGRSLPNSRKTQASPKSDSKIDTKNNFRFLY